MRDFQKNLRERERETGIQNFAGETRMRESRKIPVPAKNPVGSKSAGTGAGIPQKSRGTPVPAGLYWKQRKYRWPHGHACKEIGANGDSEFRN